ncbi:MAG: CehA/McbA family metallohydrolase [Deltaproteobacteria bacterium]|nr:CehA/McbA family metallohydrolase [Deltaproteobacteria bacterium]
MVLLLALLGCHRAVDDTAQPDPVDLTVPLPADEARAGLITDPAALFAGLAAEGRPGDYKLYNDRVQFILQGMRDGSHYLPEGGSIIDADLVRPEGHLGRDLVDEWAPMYGLGRVMTPTSIEVISQGGPSEAAVIRVRGDEVAMGLLEGALESPGMIPHLGLSIETTYTLPPGSWLMEVTTKVTAEDEPATLGVADLIMGGPEMASPWVEGQAFGEDGSGGYRWSAYVEDENQLAVGLFAPEGVRLSDTGYQLISSLAEMVVGAGPAQTIAQGETLTWTRYYGVAPDLAHLTDAVLAGQATTLTEGTVEAPDGPVAGARVHVAVEGSPFSLAITDESGHFALQTPAGAEVSVLAEGRGRGFFNDLGEGHVPYSPYTSPALRQATLAALVEGAPVGPTARGRGTASPEAPLTLRQPGTLTLTEAGGHPFEARLSFVGGDPDASAPAALAQTRPQGRAALAWSRGGPVSLTLEPGTYRVLTHRGPAAELEVNEVTIASGERLALEVDLPTAFAASGWLRGDLHCHASPSPDGKVTMEERILTVAGAGIQAHFGTDHDHLADYRPIVAALGLEGVTRSVVSDEVSPPLRGHMNIYPVASDPEAPNGGAWRWWAQIPESTEAEVDALREAHGDDFILQSNHPTSGGVPLAAGWSPGEIDNPDFWTERLQAMEVMNGGSRDDFGEVWWDLIQRGYPVTPTGTSDAHSHIGGDHGYSFTWLGAGVDAPADLTDPLIVETMLAMRVQPSRGPFLELSVAPGSDVAAGTELRVQAHTASWYAIDRLLLLKDGVEVGRVEGAEGTFTLDTDQDAVFVVEAEGDSPMQPISSRQPWAMSGPYFADAGGDGWTAPLPPFAL